VNPPTITELEKVAAWLDIKPSELAALRKPPGGERPRLNLQKLSEPAIRIYADEMLSESRRALVELERRQAQRAVAPLTPEQRRAQMRTVQP
jgi:hypothetical protein